MLTANISLLDWLLDDKTALIDHLSLRKVSTAATGGLKKLAKFSLILTFLKMVEPHISYLVCVCISTYVCPLPRESAMEYKMLFSQPLPWVEGANRIMRMKLYGGDRVPWINALRSLGLLSSNFEHIQPFFY